MSSSLQNLSGYQPESVPHLPNARIGVVVSEWNWDITGALLDGALKTLDHHGIPREQIFLLHVPGSFELPWRAQQLLERENCDAVITLGCVIQGETRHFDFICDACAHGIMELGIRYQKPVIFGVLTTNNLDQAIDRSGGKHGNKGVEAAVTALKMLGSTINHP